MVDKLLAFEGSIAPSGAVTLEVGGHRVGRLESVDELALALREAHARGGAIVRDVRTVSESHRFVWYRTEGTVRGRLDGSLEWGGSAMDVSDLKLAQLTLAGQARVWSLLLADADLAVSLRELILAMEAVVPDIYGTVLLVDPSGHLHHEASPSWPPSFAETFDGYAIGPTAGTCGVAAFFNRVAITRDIEEDPNWQSYRDRIAPYGVRACWSTPIRARDGSVLGTFAMYTPTPRTPNAEDLDLLALAGTTAAVAIERTRAAEDLAVRQAKLRLALEAGDMATWEWHPASGKLVLGHEEALFGRALAVAPETLEDWLTHVVEADRAPFRRELARMAASTEPVAFECRVVRDGGTGWICCRGRAMSGAGAGEPVVVQGVMLDLTRGKRADDALRESEGRYRLLAEHGTGIIARVGEDGKFVYVSPASETLLGYPPADLVGRRASTLLPLEDRPLVAAALRGLPAPEMPPTRAVHRLRKGDGEWLWVESTFRRRTAERAARELVVSVRDVTSEKRLEEQVHHAQRMEVVGRFAGSIAHDFNNLLTVVVGSASLLEPSVDDDPNARALLDEITGAAERGAYLTRRLLTFARPHDERLGSSDVNGVLGGMRGMLERLVGADDVTLAFDLSPEVRGALIGANELEQVVMNLVANARDALPTGGNIVISTRPCGAPLPGDEPPERANAEGYALIAVRDDGIGMDERVRERAFDPFFTTKGPERGTGLGLATVRSVIHHAGGFLALRSHPGRGTEVRAYLARASHFPTAPPKAVPALDPGSGLVLLVDDDRAVRTLAAKIIQSLGYDVVEASDGVEALRLLRTRPQVCLLVSEMSMRHGDGVELLRRLRKERPTLPSLLLSGERAAPPREKGSSAPTFFLEKPFTRERLAEAMHRLLGAGSAPFSGLAGSLRE